MRNDDFKLKLLKIIVIMRGSAWKTLKSSRRDLKLLYLSKCDGCPV